MGQEIILDCLAKHPRRWLSANDLSKLTKIGLPSISSALRRLRKHMIVRWKESKTHNGVAFYVYNHKK